MTPELIIIFVLWGIINLQFGRRIEIQAMQRHSKEMIEAINKAKGQEENKHE